MPSFTEINFLHMFAGLLMISGFIFSLAATIGVLRLPDFYSRLHASGKNETLGLMLILSGLAIYEGISLLTVKLLFIVVFVLTFNASGVHVLARTAWRDGIKPWQKG